MKKVLRIIVIVVANLLTLPFQLVMIIGYLLTKKTEEEKAEINEFWEEGFSSCKRWTNTGRFDVPEERAQQGLFPFIVREKYTPFYGGIKLDMKKEDK